MLHFKFTIDALAAHWGAKALPQRPSLFEGKGEEEMKEGEKERKGDGRKEKKGREREMEDRNFRILHPKKKKSRHPVVNCMFFLTALFVISVDNYKLQA